MYRVHMMIACLLLTVRGCNFLHCYTQGVKLVLKLSARMDSFSATI